MSELRSETIPSFDGTKLAVHRLGEGHPVLLLHGLFSSAEVNWIRFGHAQKLADAGFEAIMPDLRAHGQSAAPHDPSAYPPGVLLRDAEALVAALGLTVFDLVGFSLGARTAAAVVIDGLSPRRLVLAGMGLDGLLSLQRRTGFFLDAIARFHSVTREDPAYMAVQFMKTTKVDRQAARLLLHAIGDVDREGLSRMTMPTLVLCGEDDHDNGSPEDLAATLPDADFESVPGTHMSSVTQGAMGRKIVAFLDR